MSLGRIICNRIESVTDGDGEAGFTLIELLTVLILIGVLAGIAITTFDRQTSKAGDASAKSDVRNIATLEESYLSSGNTYGSALQLAASTTRLPASRNDTVYVYTSGATGYCLVGHNSGSSSYFIDNSLGGGLSATTYSTLPSAQTTCTAAGFTAAGTIANSGSGPVAS